jgi:hypothetical protein
MKRTFYTISAMVCLIIMTTSTDFNAISPPENVSMIKKQHCFGYTVIEAGKGIDCYGDTINLVKRYGFYEIASRSKPEKPHELILN